MVMLELVVLVNAWRICLASSFLSCLFQFSLRTYLRHYGVSLSSWWRQSQLTLQRASAVTSLNQHHSSWQRDIDKKTCNRSQQELCKGTRIFTPLFICTSAHLQYHLSLYVLLSESHLLLFLFTLPKSSEFLSHFWIQYSCPWPCCHILIWSYPS